MIKLKHLLYERLYISNHDEVVEIQTILDKLGYSLGPPGIDGIFGPYTKKAVKDYQRDNGTIRIDGLVGPETWPELQKEKEKLNISNDEIEQNKKKTSKNSNIHTEPDDEIEATTLDTSSGVIVRGSYPIEFVRLVEESMDKYGIRNPFTRIAILSVIAKESGFIPQSEKSYRNTSNSRIRKLFGRRVPKDDDELTQLKADDKLFFDKVYGGRYGNASDEGYKYRGRGFNQLTFKSAYKKYGRLIGKDLESDPNLLNDPEIAGMVSVMFLKNRLQNKFGSSLGDFKNQSEANAAVANANAGWGKERGTSSLETAIEKNEYIIYKFFISRIRTRRSNSMIKLKNILNESDGSSMRGSQWLFDFIKDEEGDPKQKGEPILTSYKQAGDVWTIGYGHTAGVTADMTITKTQAIQFMYDDLTEAANCVRRLFTRWNQQKLDIQITQEQFDVLVSLVFNTGCSAMLKSEFIQSIKQNKFKEAAQKILTYRLKTGFSGLNVRRKKESNHFLKNI